MSNPFTEAEFVRDVTKTAVMAPFKLYQQAWEGWDNKGQDSGGGDSNPFLSPLSSQMSRLSDQMMQQQLDDALRVNIYI